MQDEMTDMMAAMRREQWDIINSCRSYNIPDYIDEEELMGGMEDTISSWQYNIYIWI
jgi:hypothetical protein